MSVDKLRDSFHVNRIPPAALNDRLIAQSYRPDIIRAIDEIRESTSWMPLRDMCVRRVAQGRTPEYGDDGPICLKTRNVVGIEVSEESVDRVSRNYSSQNSNLRIGANTVLLNRSGAGSIGRTSVYLGSDRPFTNEELFRFQVSAPHDAAFVTCFLSSWWGERALEQGVNGSTGQLKLVQDHVEQLAILTPPPEVQAYIGDKVRMAERLRERARRLEASVAKVHSNFIASAVGIDFGRRTRRLRSHNLTERLDAHFYPAAVEEYLSRVGCETRRLECLTSLVENGQTQPRAEVGVLQATVTNLGQSFVEGTLRTVDRPSNSSHRLREHDLLICNAAHNKSYVGRDVSYCHLDAAVYPSTEVMVIRVDRSQAPASFVRQYLKSKIGYLQIQSTIRGITAHSYPSDVRLIEVPLPSVPAPDRLEWFATDDQMLLAGRCVATAQLLASAAKLLVEHLIDGKISEPALVAAQTALKQGEPGKDLEILDGVLSVLCGPGEHGAQHSIEVARSLVAAADKIGATHEH